MPIFFPAGVALGADPAMLAGAVLSGAIFGDNLAPVSDVTVISSVTQRCFRNGTPADIAGVVFTRFPYALIALAVSLPVYAFMGESLPVSEAALLGDASAPSNARSRRRPHRRCGQDPRRTDGNLGGHRDGHG